MPHSDPEVRKAYEREKSKRYYQANKEKKADYKRRNWEKHKEHQRNYMRRRRQNKDQKLKDLIIRCGAKYRLTKQLGCRCDEVPPELVETKLAILNVTRKIKELSK